LIVDSTAAVVIANTPGLAWFRKFRTGFFLSIENEKSTRPRRSMDLSIKLLGKNRYKLLEATHFVVKAACWSAARVSVIDNPLLSSIVARTGVTTRQAPSQAIVSGIGGA
jgi:hypothetical protein